MPLDDTLHVLDAMTRVVDGRLPDARLGVSQDGQPPAPDLSSIDMCQPEAEVCDGQDNDCDLHIDEAEGDESDLCGSQRFHRFEICVEVVDWLSAVAVCEARGLDLATIRSHEEMLHILISTLDDGFPVMDQNQNVFWIGLNDRTVEGEFVWSNDEDVDARFWHDNEPNDFGGDEDCVSLQVRDNRFLWNDYSCHRPLSFICAQP